LKNSSAIQHQQWMNQTLAMGAGSGGSGSQDHIEAKKQQGIPFNNVKNRLPIDLRGNAIQQPGLQIL
jgi:hypothetical protein